MAKVKSIKTLKAKAVKVFNAYIRNRDKDKGCITCSSFRIDHACHFYSAGHHSALMFSEDNVHGGCLRCNYFKHGATGDYRRRLEERIGLRRLQILDAVATRNPVKKWNSTELEYIIERYGG